MPTERTVSSPYMEWAKTHQQARYNLATSGVQNYPLNRLPVSIEDLDTCGKPGYGYDALIEALADKMKVTVDMVVTAAGTSMANHLAMAAIIEPGDEVLIEHPTYELLVSTARYLGAAASSFERRFEDGFRIDPDEVRKKVTARTRLIVITNLHNPTGVLTDSATIKEIGRIASRVGARVLVDEVYLEATFERFPGTAALLGDEFIVTSSLTKAYGLSGLRCGWILASRELAGRIWRLNDLFSATGAYPAEQLSVIALKNLDTIIARSKAILDPNRAALLEFLKSCDFIEAVEPEFGTIAFPRVKEGSIDAFLNLLREIYETSVVPGRFFGADNHFRMGVGGDSEMVKKGLERISTAVSDPSLS